MGTKKCFGSFAEAGESPLLRTLRDGARVRGRALILSEGRRGGRHWDVKSVYAGCSGWET